jgi:hypothetical protein
MLIFKKILHIILLTTALLLQINSGYKLETFEESLIELESSMQ